MKTILFADDNQGVREFCREELEDEGYRVVLARNGEEAIRALRKETPDVVVLDLRMPGMGGLDAVEQIRKLAPRLPVIFFTANDDDCLRDRRSRLATGCVEKSEDLSELKRRIVQVLTSPHATDAIRPGLPRAVPESAAGHSSSPRHPKVFERSQKHVGTEP
jgi:CheY-like chemotaxis protein